MPGLCNNFWEQVCFWLTGHAFTFRTADSHYSSHQNSRGSKNSFQTRIVTERKIDFSGVFIANQLWLIKLLNYFNFNSVFIGKLPEL